MTYSRDQRASVVDHSQAWNPIDTATPVLEAYYSLVANPTIATKLAYANAMMVMVMHGHMSAALYRKNYAWAEGLVKP